MADHNDGRPLAHTAPPHMTEQIRVEPLPAQNTTTKKKGRSYPHTATPPPNTKPINLVSKLHLIHMQSKKINKHNPPSHISTQALARTLL